MYFARLRICCSTAEDSSRGREMKNGGKKLVKLDATIV
jgi:hypothetical protein